MQTNADSGSISSGGIVGASGLAAGADGALASCPWYSVYYVGVWSLTWKGKNE